MIQVAIVVTERCQASSVYTMVDMLLAANFAASHYLNRAAAPLFDVRLLGLRTTEKAYNGCHVTRLEKVNLAFMPDMVLLPGAFEAVLDVGQAQKLLARLGPLYPVLQSWHSAGALIGSVCTGNFVLAQAGLAKGRTLSCHWASEHTARGLFPDQPFVSHKLLVDHGDIVAAGGALAVSQLMLYLIQRHGGRELALITAKLMMVEPSDENLSRFAIFRAGKEHGDDVVQALQTLIEERFAQALDFKAFANRRGLTERHLNRRFKKATGETPLSYQQRIRVEQVKARLETTRKPVAAIIHDVGYEDLTSFRRLFKRLTGMTMQDYRDRLGGLQPLPAHAVAATPSHARAC